MKQPATERRTVRGQTRRMRAGLTATAAAAVLAVACAACGSSSGQASSASAAPSHGTVNVTVGNAAATYAKAPFVVAETNGALAAHGVTDSFAVLAARAKGVPVVAVCGLYQGVPGLALVVRPA